MRSGGKAGRFCRALAVLAIGGGLALVSAACSRTDVYRGRIQAIPSEKAHEVLSEALWVHGSYFRWADHHNLECQLTWTEFRPLGVTAATEVWLLDTARGRMRIEAPATQEVTLFDGAVWRFLKEGKAVEDPVARFRRAGLARVARELLPMPFSLLEPGLDIGYMGSVTGPGETRTWQELLVAYQGFAGRATHDRMIVEVRQSNSRVVAAVVQWPELPFAGRRYRVEMDDWHTHEGLLLAHRFRFYWADDKGGATGPLRFEARVTALALDVPEKLATFVRP